MVAMSPEHADVIQTPEYGPHPPSPVVNNAEDLEKVILAAEAGGRRIGAFLYEPMLVIPGVHTPPPLLLFLVAWLDVLIIF